MIPGGILSQESRQGRLQVKQMLAGFTKKEIVMRKFMFAVVVLFSILPVFSEPSRQEPHVIIARDLNTIENMYLKYLNSSEQREAIGLLNEIRSLLYQIDSKEKETFPKVDPNILSNDSFISLLDNVNREKADFNKTPIIQAIGKKGKVTCAQLEKLVATYTFDSYKVEIIKWIADNIIDPVNIGIVLVHIDNSYTRKEISDFFQNR
jgi:hypothetical protein